MKRYILPVVIIGLVLIGQFTIIHRMYMMSPIYHFVMHVMGGLGIGLLAGTFISGSPIKRGTKIVIVVASAMLAGLVWEFLEVYFHVTGRIPWSAIYYSDTAKDLLNDLIGGIIASRFNIKNHQND